MGKIGKDFDYKVINNFLKKDELKLLNKHCEILHRTNITNFDPSSSVLDTAIYGDPVFESMMLVKQNIIEKTTGFDLLGTYTYWRMYTKYSDLKKHKDRSSCEISVTVNIGGDKEWPIYMDDNPINLEPGDAAVYLGAKVPHYRKTFEGDWNAQVFLHYVKKDGLYKDNYMDRRNYWSLPSTHWHLKEN
jgi:hypothetical protein